MGITHFDGILLNGYIYTNLVHQHLVLLYACHCYASHNK